MDYKREIKQLVEQIRDVKKLKVIYNFIKGITGK